MAENEEDEWGGVRLSGKMCEKEGAGGGNFSEGFIFVLGGLLFDSNSGQPDS